MDILSHALWAGAAGKGVNIKRIEAKKKPLKIWLMAFFGLFPDFFAFAFSFAWYFGSRIFPFIPEISPMRPGFEPVGQNSLFIWNLTHQLYNISHSLFVFLLVFGLVWYFRKKPLWEMTGWLIHILMDIPSHSYRFFPTPFLWPVSDFKIDGISWATPWFMITNYSLLLAAYLTLWFIKRNFSRAKP